MSVATSWPPGDSAMAELIRGKDWATTPLGAVDTWPQALRATLTMMLDHPLPMILGWGPGLVSLYNDAYLPLLGEKQDVLGRPLLDVWDEARVVAAPQIAQAMTGEACYFCNARVMLRRGDQTEEAFFDYTYSPVRNETHVVVGVLNTAIEVTNKVRLRESEARFRLTLQGVADAFYALDRDWKFLFASSAALKLWKKDSTDILGRTLIEAFPGIESSEPYDAHVRVMSSRTPEHCESVSPVLQRWIELDIAPTPEGGISVAFRDIEDRKAAAEALAEEFKYTRILQDLSARLVTEENIQTVYEDVLSAAIEITRAKAGTVQMLNDQNEELAILATRGFSQRTTEYFGRVDAGSQTSCGIALRTKSRTYLDFDQASTDVAIRMHVEDGVLSALSLPLLSRSGKPIGMVSTHWGEFGHRPSERELRFLDLLIRQAADLIEQRRAEAALRERDRRYHTLFSASPAPFLIVKPDAPRFTITAVNNAYLSATMRKRDEIVGRGIFEAYPDNPDAAIIGSVSTLRASLERVIASRRPDPLPGLKYDIARPDGTFEERWWSPVNSPVLGKNGEVEAIIHNAHDVTEEHRAEAELRYRAEQFETLVRQAPIGIYLIDSNFCIVQVNPIAQPVFGDIPDLVGRDFDEVIHILWDKSYADEVVELFRQTLETGKPYETPERAESRADLGLVEYYSWNINRITLPNGSYGVVCYFSDISEQVRARLAIAESEKKYRALFEGMGEGFVILERVDSGEYERRDYRYMIANPAWARHTGLPNWQGHTVLELTPAMEASVFDHFDAALSTGTTQVFEGYHASGKYWVHAEAFPTGQPHQVAVVFSNINERKQAEEALRTSEERFRLFVENVREYALVQTDFEGIVTSWNPGAERLFGYASAEVVGKPFSMLVPEKDRHGGLIAREMAALSRGQRSSDAHFMERKDGSTFFAEWVTEPVLDDDGKLRGTAKVMRDETERQRADQNLRGSLAEKEALLAEVHHRVKNNLQVITSLLNLQSRGLKDAEISGLFNETRNRVQSIASIHEMLYRSKNFAQIDLFAYAEQLVPTLVRFYGAQSRVRVTMEGGGVSLELERAVPFGLLLNEIVSNALKHGLPPSETGMLRVSLTGNEGTIFLSVKDSGSGLPDDFEPEQVSSLGLRLVRILVKQLGGDIKFKSDAGTSVDVCIPLRAGTQNDEPTGHVQQNTDR